jgi:hypothetical protein
MFTQDQIQTAIGQDVYGVDDQKIGSLGQVYLDDVSSQPEWLSVKTGMFGMKETLVPATDAVLLDDRVTIPFSADQIKDAPNVDADYDRLTPEEEERLYRHYGREHDYISWQNSSIEQQGAVSDSMSGTAPQFSETSVSQPVETNVRLRRWVVTEATETPSGQTQATGQQSTR